MNEELTCPCDTCEGYYGCEINCSLINEPGPIEYESEEERAYYEQLYALKS